MPTVILTITAPELDMLPAATAEAAVHIVFGSLAGACERRTDAEGGGHSNLFGHGREYSWRFRMTQEVRHAE